MADLMDDGTNYNYDQWSAYLSRLPWIFLGAPLKDNGAPRNVHGNLTVLDQCIHQKVGIWTTLWVFSELYAYYKPEDPFYCQTTASCVCFWYVWWVCGVCQCRTCQSCLSVLQKSLVMLPNPLVCFYKTAITCQDVRPAQIQLCLPCFYFRNKTPGVSPKCYFLSPEITTSSSNPNIHDHISGRNVGLIYLTLWLLNIFEKT